MTEQSSAGHRVVRLLFLAHRYLGMAMGLFMLMWCLSGIVMMYVPYPSLPEREREQALSAIDWSKCCAWGTAEIDATGSTIEAMGSTPVLRSGGGTIDLRSGKRLDGISREAALSVARGFGASNPRIIDEVVRDQWTVSGDFNDARPFWRIALGDEADTELYVSRRDGRAVQRTSSRERFWNYLGAVPHWLYFTPLRRNAVLWSQIVIYLALAGTVLTVLGLTAGVIQFVRRPDGHWTGYRGLLAWHHLPALGFGLFAFTWIASGLLSMNPWGWLEGQGSEREQIVLSRTTARSSELRFTIERIAARRPSNVVALTAVPLLGGTYLLETAKGGGRRRLNLAGNPALLMDADWQAIGRALGIPDPKLLDREDTYYFSHHGELVRLPVYRSIGADSTRYYFDAVTGSFVGKVDGGAAGYRWLHQGLHRLDFAGLARPLWDLVMLFLLGGVMLVTATGTLLGLRRIARAISRK